MPWVGLDFEMCDMDLVRCDTTCGDDASIIDDGGMLDDGGTNGTEKTIVSFCLNAPPSAIVPLFVSPEEIRL